jgi:iron(III)-salmochelin esterase
MRWGFGPNTWAVVLLGLWLAVTILLATLSTRRSVNWDVTFSGNGDGAVARSVRTGVPGRISWSATASSSQAAPMGSGSAAPMGSGSAAPMGSGSAAPMGSGSAPVRDSHTLGQGAPTESTAPAGDGPRRLAAQELTWVFEATPFGRIDVVVVLPPRSPSERFPMLIALHGRGEAMKGSEKGARGWVDDYALPRAIQRLSSPPLTTRDFEGFVSPSRLSLLNESLRVQPYRGLVVVCPYTVDVLAGDRPFSAVKPYAKWLLEVVVERAYRELPVMGTPATTGIDGVSLGGRVSILSGLYEPRAFGAVGGLQAAFDSDDALSLARLATVARAQNPELRFRLLTSEDDPFLNANRAISAEWRRYQIDHRLLVVPGPHDYVFNRGPGALEMLLFHERTLRGKSTP